MDMDAATIFAPASAIGRAGVTVFRVSGPRAGEVARLLCGLNSVEPRRAVLGILRHPVTGEMLDRALIVFFPAPHSFTGEDVIELHTHGGRAVALAVTQALSILPGLRLAEPGEFTRRAFENGKMDLTEAEAIADLVHAETEAQRKQALRQMEGALGDLYEAWTQQMLRCLAHLEAAIDFADEDLPADLAARQQTELAALHDAITRHLNDGHRGEMLREGVHIAILGAPNAGKSSLLNALARREAAIVSSTAGTTRDVIETHLDLGGYPVVLADTAGLRDSEDGIESEGVRRALARAEQADLKLLVYDGAHWPRRDPATEKLQDENALILVNKVDLLPLDKQTGADIFVSAETGESMPALLEKLAAMVKARLQESAAPPLTRARHRAALEQCRDHLARALDPALTVELRAEDARLALRALGRITGRVDVEDILDVIFRDFCIGK
jgi:tRNA modification GTPase